PVSMVILPLVEVKSAVEVLVVTSVSARADISVASGAASRAAAAAESIKRCLINSASLKCRRAGYRRSRHCLSKVRSRTLSTSPRAQQGMAPFTLSPGGPPPVRDKGQVPAGPPLYPAIVPVQQQFSSLPGRIGPEISPLIRC